MVTDDISGRHRTRAIVGVNDMSLEKGGVFDIDADWMKPHGLHRNGVAADIDRAWTFADGSVRVVECIDDHALRDAVERRGATLRCERAEVDHKIIYKKHIDF